jgi:hypothetical protein
MPRAVLVFVLVSFLLFTLGCGNDLEVVATDIEPSSANLIGIGATQQIKVLAKYSDGREPEDVTLRSTFQIEPPALAPFAPTGAITINASGLLMAMDGACTWTKGGTEEDPTYGTNPYRLIATYENHQAVAFISIASIVDCEFPDPENASKVKVVVNTAN